MLRPCLDCGRLTRERTRCSTCRKAADKLRGTATQRGYGAAHRAARMELKARLPDECGYGCGTWLEPEGDWVAAHVVDGAPEYGYLASCRTCNERAKRTR